MPLEDYRRKREFRKTPEPPGARPAGGRANGLRFVVQKHAARRLHYDFRVELEGVLLSWAVPKGPCLDPTEKRLAVRVEDHPLEYAEFEGAIPRGEYGGGTVIVWDRGTWTPEGDAVAAVAAGQMKFRLEGSKLRGRWALIRMRAKPGESSENWLLIKERDAEARPLGSYDVLDDRPESVLSGKTLDEVAATPHLPGGSPDRDFDPPPARSKASGRRDAPMPTFIPPQLAAATSVVPEGDRWLHEIKFDGYRLLAFLDGGRVVLRTRNNLDWTHRFPELAAAVTAFPARSAVLDGEVVALLPTGASSFAELLAALSAGETGRLVYYVFDLLYLDGVDLRRSPLVARKRQLAGLVAAAGQKRLQYADHLVGDGAEFFHQCAALGLEGIISKRADGAHVDGRSDDWLKRKCVQRDEFVIGGFTVSDATRRGVRAILVGTFDPAGRLIYAGKVGSGFSDETLRDLRERLMARQTEASPFADLPARDAERGTRWVRPELVAQVEYANRSRDGMVRHAVFLGLREDKPAAEVISVGLLDADDRNGTGGHRLVETPRAAIEPAASGLSSRELADLWRVRFTNPEKVLYPREGITKLGLATFYSQISDWILPHVSGRLLSLVRCPDGEGGKSFFQQHAGAGMPDTVHCLPVANDGTEQTHLMIDSLAGLVSLVQMSVLELHPWGSRVDNLERPDRIVLDLDPDPAVAWPLVVAAAHEIRARLDDLRLVSFVKTTGGRGLHVVVPIQRRNSWDDVKSFARTFAERMAADAPSRYTATLAKSARRGKIFLDFLRNRRGATTVAAYSTRARPGAPVSTPLTWEELTPAVRSDQFHVGNLPDRLAGLERDPWAGLWDAKQSITAAVRRKLGI